MSENSHNIESSSQSASPSATPSSRSTTGSLAATVGVRTSTVSPPSLLQRRGFHSLSEHSLVPSTATAAAVTGHNIRSQTSSPLSQRSHTPSSSRVNEHRRHGSGSSSGASQSAHGKRRSRDRRSLTTGEEYWAQWIPETGSTVQQFRSDPVGSEFSIGPVELGESSPGPSSRPQTPQRPSTSPPATERRSAQSAYSFPADHGTRYPYPLVASSEHFGAPGPSKGSESSYRRSAHAGSSMSAVMERPAMQSRALYPEPTTPLTRPGPSPPVSGPSRRNAYAVPPVSTSDLLLGQYSTHSVQGLPPLPNSPMAQGTHSLHSSHSSRSDLKSQHNFSYPLDRNHSSQSDHHDMSRTTPEAMKDPRPSTATSQMGVDGQIDRSRYRVNRSKSSSTDYSTEAFRRLHGGVIPNIDLGSGGRARPPLTSRTSSHYSKLPDPTIPPIPNTTRRASYSSVTGISPVAERYITAFSNSSSEPSSISRGISNTRPLTIDTHFTQADGALSSPRGPGSVPESPIAAHQFIEGTFFPNTPAERKRVDDFGFLNTIEASERPYTPDQFAFDAGMLNIDPTTTRHSSQKSKRSMASFGTQSKRSTGQASMPANQNPTGSIGRNVLRKRRPSLKPHRANSLEIGPVAGADSRPSTMENRCFLTGSLRSRPLDVDYSLVMPHTATTSAGPSRGLIIDGYNTVPGNIGTPRRSSRGSVFSVLNGKGNPISDGEPRDGKASVSKTSVSKASVGKASVGSLLDGFESSNPVGSSSKGRPKRRNTFSHVLGTKCTASSPNLESASFPELANVTPSPTDAASSKSTYTASRGRRHLSFLYSKGKQVLRDVWHEGWTAALEDFRNRRAAEKTQRYGVAGKTRPAFMSGALPAGSTRTSRIGRKLGDWSRFKRRSKSASSHGTTDGQGAQDGHGGQRGFQGGFQGGHVGEYSEAFEMEAAAVATATATDTATATVTVTAVEASPSPASTNKKSAFTEVFERTRTISAELRRERDGVLKKLKECAGSAAD
ncbi:hypothetical protein BZA05DRAFT_447418 [Tricharina praecox]|uniref:uncharacterized protein n=1 Tax=Tricharina praecox TaxID=43433 RepID=UPI00222054CA|nr:uncharacterized protein BZA05DRAFT_447418 [Tricharina praecox]KAI5846784.1 hypothetical protein BZA05DRAFT_447418 [Tricharina praecox]